MLRGLLYFLLGAFVLVVVLYITNMVIGMMALPPGIAHIAMLIVGLAGLVCIVILAIRAAGGTPPNLGL